MDCESKMEPPGSPDREGGERDACADGMGDCEGLKGVADETEDSKKRKRKPYRPGKPLGMIHFTSFKAWKKKKNPCKFFTVVTSKRQTLLCAIGIFL